MVAQPGCEQSAAKDRRRHAGEPRPEQTERENLVKNNVGGQQKKKTAQHRCGSAPKPVAVVRRFGRHRKPGR